jgi:hypothetical protein
VGKANMTSDQSQIDTERQVALPGNTPLRLDNPEVENTPQKNILTQSPFSENKNKVQWQFSIETHKYVREFINGADNKSQHYIAFASAFLVWVNSRESLNFWSIPAKEWRFLDLLNIISIVGMTICILLALWALLPRLNGSKKGIIFFDSIAEHEISNDYLADVLKKSEQELVIEELKHVFELSRICSKKFFYLKLSVWSGSIGLTSGIILLLMK